MRALWVLAGVLVLVVLIGAAVESPKAQVSEHAASGSVAPTTSGVIPSPLSQECRVVCLEISSTQIANQLVTEKAQAITQVLIKGADATPAELALNDAMGLEIGCLRTLIEKTKAYGVPAGLIAAEGAAMRGLDEERAGIERFDIAEINAGAMLLREAGRQLAAAQAAVASACTR